MTLEEEVRELAKFAKAASAKLAQATTEERNGALYAMAAALRAQAPAIVEANGEDMEAARAAGKKAVRLDTFVTNARGRRLYDSCGFDCLGTHVLRYGNLGPTAVALYEKAL